MITMSAFGTHGRMGQQLFQYAMLRSVGDETGYEVALPQIAQLAGFKASPGIGIYDPEIKHRWREPTVRYHREVFDQPDGTDYRGEFPSYRYFERHESLVRREYRIQEEIDKWAAQYVADLPSPVAVLHVRRGDRCMYCAAEDEAAIYQGRMVAVDDALNPATWLIVSDDHEWCEQFLPAVPLVVSPSPWHDLAVMTKCDGHALAKGSAFSWWGAWLAHSQCVVASWPWFQTVESSLDALPAEWLRYTDPPAVGRGDGRKWKRTRLLRGESTYRPTASEIHRPSPARVPATQHPPKRRRRVDYL